MTTFFEAAWEAAGRYGKPKPMPVTVWNNTGVTGTRTKEHHEMRRANQLAINAEAIRIMQQRGRR